MSTRKTPTRAPRLRLAPPRFRSVYARGNSTCGSVPIYYLSSDWRTDGNASEPLYLHVRRYLDDTWHRVHPRPMPGYVCRRLAMRDGTLCWVYDARRLTQPKGAGR